MSLHRHRNEAPPRVSAAIVTVSDTRTPDTDESGRLARTLVEEAGHSVAVSLITPDEPERLRGEIERLLERADVDLVLVNGGTGISPRDRTYEAVAGLIERRLDGFGEIFRTLSYGEIGAAAMLSRAVAGLARGKPVFSMPGSPDAVRLALEKLILPEIGHLVAETRKEGRRHP
jgi:molybdenum cofactor biosynthesis protein B